MTLKLYGLKNCDSCRKAVKWLNDNAIVHEFVDLKKTQLTASDITRFLKAVGPALINRRGTTWRKLSPNQQAQAETAKAADLLLANTSLMKRPIFDTGNALFVGFDDNARTRLSALA